MKILIIIALFIFLKILFKKKIIKKTDPSSVDSDKYPDKEKNNEIIDVDYEELK